MSARARKCCDDAKYLCARAAVTLTVVASALAQSERPAAQTWPSFRGPNACGVADGAPLAAEWDAPQDKGVRWKTAIPGLGHSSPVIWGERVFVTTAVSGHEDADLKVGLYGNIASVEDDSVHAWRLYCLDRESGKVLWEQTALEAAPRVKRHTKATHANSTPATDGRHVVTFFGSEGLWCYDVDGKLLWKKDLGMLDAGYYVVPAAQWGFGSSPIIHDDMVIILCDVQKDSFLAALDVNDGHELWRTPRDEVPTWGSPTIYKAGDELRIAVNGYKHIGGYDLRTGAPRWSIKGGGDIPVPTPVVADDLIYLTNAHGQMRPIYAVRSSASGDVTPASKEEPGEHVAWWRPDRGNYMQTPLVYRDLLYCCMDQGILTCFDAKTGETHYRKRLGAGQTGFTASPVAGDGKVYFTSEEGDVYVVKAGADFELLATNPMGEVCLATPAICDGVLFFRTKGHVVAIGP